MAVEILIAARDLPPYLKGDIVVARPSPAVWGGKEGPPDFARLTITDADMADVQPYLDDFQNILQHEFLGTVAGKRRVRVFVDPGVAGKIDDAKAFRAELRDFFVDEWGAVVVAHAAIEATLDFPNTINLADVQSDLIDKFDERIFERRWHFDPADVDAVIGMGGFIDRTKAQVANQILDRRG